MMYKVFKLIFLFNVWFVSNIHADIIKYPNYSITHYPASVHGGVRATWGINQDKDGKLIFINTYGILSYDGSIWRSLKLEGNQIPRAIQTDENKNILIGYNEQFGMLSFDNKGQTKFKSLASLKLSPYATPREIIQIPDTKDYFIRTPNGIYIYNNKNVSLLKTPKEFRFGVSHKVNNEIYVYVRKKGLFKYKGKKLEIVKGTEIFKSTKQTIYGVSKFKNGLLLVTRKSGLYYLENNILKKVKLNIDLIEKTTIYRSIKIKNKGFALATYNGLFILDKNLKVTGHFNKDNGLVNSNVRSLFVDRDENLWIGLNDGISKLKQMNGITFFDRNYANINSIVNNVEVHNNTLYLSSSTGLKKLKTDENSLKQDFISVAENKLQTQTWKIAGNDNKLFIGSNKGLGFLNEKDEYLDFIDKKITGSIYTMKVSKLFPNMMLVGGKKGFSIINLTNKKVFKFPEIDIDRVWEISENRINQEIFVRILKKGIFKIKFKDLSNPESDYSISKYTLVEGLPDKYYDIRFLQVKGETLLSTDNGIYKFSKKEKKVIKDDRFSNIKHFKSKKILSYIKLRNGDIWVATSERINNVRNVALFKINEKFQVKPIGIDQDILNSFSRINLNVIKNKIVLTGTNGLMIIPESYQLKKPNGQSLISSLIINNKKIYDGSPKINFLNEQLKVQNIFNYDQNQINFKISNSDYVNELKNKYRFKLVGLDDTFSDYSYNNNITFTNLSHGSYKFIVEGVNANNQNLVPLEYSFTITPPWWETSLFYICEIGFFIFLLLLTALSKNTSGSEKIATAMTFIVIIIFFEFLNMMIDPYLIILTGGVPVFDLISKVILGALLLPVENIASKLLDKFSAFINKNKKINQKVRNS